MDSDHKLESASVGSDLVPMPIQFSKTLQAIPVGPVHALPGGQSGLEQWSAS